MPPRHGKRGFVLRLSISIISLVPQIKRKIRVRAMQLGSARLRWLVFRYSGAPLGAHGPFTSSCQVPESGLMHEQQHHLINVVPDSSQGSKHIRSLIRYQIGGLLPPRKIVVGQWNCSLSNGLLIGLQAGDGAGTCAVSAPPPPPLLRSAAAASPACLPGCCAVAAPWPAAALSCTERATATLDAAGLTRGSSAIPIRD